MYLRTEGKTSVADAIEDLSGDFTTAENNTAAVFGILLTDLGDIKKVKSISVTEQTAVASTLTVTNLGTNGLTAGGNIAIDVQTAGLDLIDASTPESATFLVVIEYDLK
jgi:hypothetical protein